LFLVNTASINDVIFIQFQGLPKYCVCVWEDRVTTLCMDRCNPTQDHARNCTVHYSCRHYIIYKHHYFQTLCGGD